MNKLISLRKQIDKADANIIKLLAKRFVIVEKIGKYKKENKLSSLDKKRWDMLLAENLTLAKSHNLPKDFITKLFKTIHQYSLKLQKDL